MKKKKQTKADLYRYWGIPEKLIRGGGLKTLLRYKGMAGIYWYWLSRQIRYEEFVMFGGKCVSCPSILERWEDGDCGHFLASGSGGFATRFMRENLAFQCKRCNNPSWSPSSPAFFAIEIDKRWGTGTAEKILNLKDVAQKEMEPEEYGVLISALPSYKNRDILTT